MTYLRIFLIVLDSLGIGLDSRAKDFSDEGSYTLLHIDEAVNGLSIPTLASLGMADLCPLKNYQPLPHPHAFSMRLKELSNGKDTLTGHWEMMGIETKVPFKTFTDTGFPKELISLLENETGYKLIGNVAASGTEIIKLLGEQSIKEKSLIIYTSSDSVLQLAAHEEVIGLSNLYQACQKAREICMEEQYKVARIIARPFIGDNPTNFKRTPNRHDYALMPPEDTVLDILSKHGYLTYGVGKINDIFATKGIKKTIKTISNSDGMNKTIDLLKNNHEAGLYFVNLVEFDSEYGHRRDPIGYGKALETFDHELKTFISYMKEDDLLLISADHGNDPTYSGTDHTREEVPLLIYSPSINEGKKLEKRNSFGDIGMTILNNFHLEKEPHMVGINIKEVK